MELEVRTCACGCGKTWRASKTSPDKYFSEIHIGANPKILLKKKKEPKDHASIKLRLIEKFRGSLG